MWTFLKVFIEFVSLLLLLYVLVFWPQEVKTSAWNAGDLGLIPGSGRSPGEGNGNPLQYSCLENPMDGGAWWATVHGVAKSRTQQSDFTFTLCRSLLPNQVLAPTSEDKVLNIGFPRKSLVSRSKSHFFFFFQKKSIFHKEKYNCIWLSICMNLFVYLYVYNQRVR